MSDETKKRTAVEVQQEYGQTAAKAGSIQYQISELKKDLALINDRMRELNFEFASITRAEQEAKKALEEANKNADVSATPILKGLN